MARLHEYQGKAILAGNGFKIPPLQREIEGRLKIPRGFESPTLYFTEMEPMSNSEGSHYRMH